MYLGPHAIFVWVSFGIVAIIILGIIGWIASQSVQQNQEITVIWRGKPVFLRHPPE